MSMLLLVVGCGCGGDVAVVAVGAWCLELGAWCLLVTGGWWLVVGWLSVVGLVGW